MAQRWEHTQVLIQWQGTQDRWVATVDGREVHGIQGVLDYYSQAGWELVTVAPEDRGVPGRLVSYRAFFKRPAASRPPIKPPPGLGRAGGQDPP